LKQLPAFALLLFSVNCWTQDKTVSIETIQSIKRSVVPVLCGYLDDKQQFKIAHIGGTGFFIDAQGRFLTPAHVLDALEKIAKVKHACTPAIYVPNHGWKKFQETIDFQYFWFFGCDTDKDLDLAVCQPIENPFTSQRVSRDNVSVVTFNNAEIPDGTPVAFTGFPAEIVSPVTSKADIAGRYSTAIYLVDKPVWGGDSGSPVYDSDGKVVGMATGTGTQDALGLGVVRAASVITDFLSKHPAHAGQGDNQTKQR